MNTDHPRITGQPDTTPNLPPALRSTAMLFALLGVLGAIYTVALVRQGIYLPSPALLGFPVCFALLRLSRVGRFMGIALAGIILFIFPFYALNYLKNGGPFQLMFLLIVMLLISSAFQLRVLLRSDIRKLFHGW